MNRILPLALALSLMGAASAAAHDCREATRSLSVEKAEGREVRSDLGLKVSLNRATGIYALNDTLYLEVSTRRDATLEIWQYDPGGRLQRLFPAPNQPALKLKANKVLRLPGKDLRLRVTRPTGVNELRVIARVETPGTATRSIQSATLAGRAVRQERRVCFTVVDP